MSNNNQRGYSPLTGEGAPNNPPSGVSSGKKYDGGQAFPSTGEGFGNPNYSAPGMTLRDWFAGNAPISMGDAYATFDGQRPTYEDVFAVLAKMRFAYADAMIAVSKDGES